MASDRVISSLQLAHVFVNGALFFAMAYQGRLGWRIRRRRVAGVLPDFSVVKRHRALGPILATLLPFGYLAGLLTVYLHKGLGVRYPGHLAIDEFWSSRVRPFWFQEEFAAPSHPCGLPILPWVCCCCAFFSSRSTWGLNIFLKQAAAMACYVPSWCSLRWIMPPETMNFIAACAETSTTRTRSRGTM